MPDDQELLERWDSQPHVIESDPNDDWNWSVELARSPSWGEVESHLRAIDIWIGEEKHLGRG